jgi:hypothetical protein
LIRVPARSILRCELTGAEIPQWRMEALDDVACEPVAHRERLSTRFLANLFFERRSSVHVPASNLFRVALVALCCLSAPLVLGCEGSASDYAYSSPTAPAVPTVPPSEPLTTAIYDRVAPQSPDVLAYHGGSLTERYLIQANGAFRLQYQSARYGFFEYLGSYLGKDGWYQFDFEGWSAAGPWEATARFHGQCMTVKYNVVMELSDFESGEYCRSTVTH